MSQHRPGAQDHRALDHVAQLAHVAGPVVPLQPLHVPAGDALDRLVHGGAELLHRRPDQQRDVLAALAQRRHADREDGEAVEEVPAEAPRLDLGPEVAVGGGDDPDVGVQRPRAADALELALLEDAQQLGLQLQRQLADLVEEDRRAVRHLEAARLAGHRPGVRPLLAAEQLALDQGRGQRRAVDLDHRPGAARAELVDPLRDQLLADPGLAFDEHRRPGGRDLLDQAQHPQDGRALADHAPAPVEQAVLLPEVPVLQLEPGS